MFVSKTKISFCYLKILLNGTLVKSHCAQYHRKIDTVAKRGSMLEEFIKNRDKRNNWHMNLAAPSTKPKVRVFDGVSKPHRRKAVLSSLFIRNITDVLSTEEIVPELFNQGVEITGVQVSPCFRTVNVFWQVPVGKFENCEEIGTLLSMAAPKIRAELISRNVLGRVPFIFFLRDGTNARIAEYENALQRVELEPKDESSIIVDDSFTKDLMSFKDSKEIKKEKEQEPVKKEEVEEAEPIPHNPPDMKCDVFGLDHNLIMNKVIATKKKRKHPAEKSALIDPETLTSEDDLFSKIPGVCFRSDAPENSESRESLLKKFHILRKMLKEKHKTRYIVEKCESNEDDCEDDDFELNSPNDFLEEETTNNR